MSVTYPGETNQYREARNALLQEEIALRAQIEKVAQMRRTLPGGGPVKEDYVFTALDGSSTKMSELFTGDRTSLGVYSLMYRPDADAPCPMCSSMLDGLAGQARHIGQRMDLVIVAAAEPEQLAALSRSRGWSDLRLLSAQGTTYQSDYHGETPDGAQLPMMNVFRRTPDGIAHFWGSEMLFVDVGGQPRHVDQLWPLWNMFDLTPEGRGSDWYPALTYEA